MGQILTVDFRGAEHFAFRRPDGIFVALKPIVEAMGLDWEGQRQRVGRDPILSEGACVIQVPFGSRGGLEATCLRLDLLHGWFFTIDTARIRDAEKREAVLAYQREAYGVLFRAFTGLADPAALTGPDRPANPVSVALAVQMVTEARRTFGTAPARLLWRQLGLPIVAGMHASPEQGALDLIPAAPASA